MYDTRGMEAFTPVMIVDMVSTVVIPEGKKRKPRSVNTDLNPH